MTQELINAEESYRMSPEMVAVATKYLETNDISATAEMLEIPVERVAYFLSKKEVKRFLDTVFLEQGYLNRNKIQTTLDRIIEKKLEELEEAEIGSSKDIADLLALAMKFRESEAKQMQREETTPKLQVNTQINGAQFGENYGSLLSKLMAGDKK